MSTGDLKYTELMDYYHQWDKNQYGPKPYYREWLDEQEKRREKERREKRVRIAHAEYKKSLMESLLPPDDRLSNRQLERIRKRLCGELANDSVKGHVVDGNVLSEDVIEMLKGPFTPKSQWGHDPIYDLKTYGIDHGKELSSISKDMMRLIEGKQDKFREEMYKTLNSLV